MQKNHPTRVLTLVYQPFALGVTALLTHHEAKINTRLWNLTGYTLFLLYKFFCNYNRKCHPFPEANTDSSLFIRCNYCAMT